MEQPEILVALAAALLLAFGFVAWERRAAAPMMPLRFFKTRAFSAGNAAGFSLYASLYGSLFFVAQFLQATLGHGPMGAGLRMLPWTASVFVVAPLAGALVSRIGERPLVVCGLALQALGFAWLALAAAPDAAYAILVPPLIIAGAGVSMAMPAAQNAALGAVSAWEVGKASGTFNMLRFLGGVFGVAVMVAVFRANGGLGSAASFGAGLAAAMLTAAALSFAGMMIGLCLPAARAPEAVAQLPSASASSS